ncbi:GNAT family N-acetyltransferase [Desulfoscipio gibsoniae]|uniref:Acetyltransferase (GNAT) family protein n=1 Tax=Desulfoscipio gibsoniae DSM 7213 TaxID=767817 RepID=R4KJ18_9FIRM|nr:GNAT family N-acetyltransferase [Desulfoscipio gibsoniae]AGL01622.1 acetyltransferase (GNAT) family protein [Desulfoscipio gibsoniae DSM 7213]
MYISKTIETKLGLLVFEGPVKGELLANYNMHAELSNFRPPDLQKAALCKITDFPEGMVFIVRNCQTVIGYVTFHYPDGYSRWRRHPAVLELGGIEVANSFRHNHVASRLLEIALSSGLMEKNIVITTEYFRHWDTNGNRMNVWEYRKMLDRLFGKFGFVVKPTDDPDIREHSVNALMARAGSELNKDDLILFERLQFKKSML